MNDGGAPSKRGHRSTNLRPTLSLSLSNHGRASPPPPAGPPARLSPFLFRNIFVWSLQFRRFRGSRKHGVSKRVLGFFFQFSIFVISASKPLRQLNPCFPRITWRGKTITNTHSPSPSPFLCARSGQKKFTAHLSIYKKKRFRIRRRKKQQKSEEAEGRTHARLAPKKKKNFYKLLPPSFTSAPPRVRRSPHAQPAPAEAERRARSRPRGRPRVQLDDVLHAQPEQRLLPRAQQPGRRQLRDPRRDQGAQLDGVL